MKIKRASSIYKVNFYCGIRIKLLEFLLFLKRTKRRLKILKKYLKNTLVSAILLFIYLIVIYFLGKMIKNYSFIKCVWESKELIFTTLVLAVSIPYYNYMKERQKNLKNQFYEYSSAYSDCTYIMCTFNKMVGVDSYRNMLWDNDKNSEYYDDVLKSDKKGEIIYSKTTILELNDEIKGLEESFDKVKKSIEKGNYIGVENQTYSYNDYVNIVIEKCKTLTKSLNRKTSKKELIKEMIEINADFHFLLADIRKPWRWDRKIDKKIDNIILENGKCISGYDIVRYRCVQTGHK